MFDLYKVSTSNSEIGKVDRFEISFFATIQACR